MVGTGRPQTDGLFGGINFTPVNVTAGDREYRFELPQRYYNWSFMMAHFPAWSWRVRKLLPSPDFEPVQVVPGVALVSLAAFEYRQVANLAPYNEVAVMVPVRHRPRLNVPLLPLLFPEKFDDLAFYILHLPVTTLEACDIGVGLWNFPKTVAEITFDEQAGRRRCRWRADGQDVLSLEVKIEETSFQTQDFFAYSIKDRQRLRTRVQTEGQYYATRLPGGASCTLGDHPIARQLRATGMWQSSLGRFYVPQARSLLHEGVGLNKRVVILGGGVAGLSAAHELMDRGFLVSVYEADDIPGGKARSYGMARTGVAGNKPLPAEHGFRFFPGFYRHVTHTMKRIPTGNGGRVFDNLVDTSRIQICRENKPPMVTLAHFPRSWEDLKVLCNALFNSNLGLEDKEIYYYMERLWQILTSCQERLFAEYEQTDWWEYIGADKIGENYARVLAEGLSRTLVAARARELNTRTAGLIILQLTFDLLKPGFSTDRVLNGPTNEVWIDPWLAHLRQQGVEYHCGMPVESIDCGLREIDSVTVRDTRTGRATAVKGDYYLAAVPVEVMTRLLTDTMCDIDPRLKGIRELALDVNLMSGVQFYLKRDVPLEHGHQLYLDSKWALTSLSQRRFWKGNDLTGYGDGGTGGIISVDISDWYSKGENGKMAVQCTDDEVAMEVWRQLKKSLNFGKEILQDVDVLRWSVCANRAERLLVNKRRSWDLRPDAYTDIPNLFLAADYIRTYTDLATMEGANEAARRAVNCIIKKSGAPARYCRIWKLREPLFVRALIFLARRRDKRRYARGLPWAGKLPPYFRFAQWVFKLLYKRLNKTSGRGAAPRQPR